MAIERVEPGRPPLLWSDIQQAFNVINQNFTELNARTDDGSSGGVNFSNLFTDVSPAITGQFNLGEDNKTWKRLFLSEINNAPGNENNGLWIGSGQISGIDGKINLPAGSTVGNELIINPVNTFFKTFTVNGQSNISADMFGDVVEFAGNGIEITTDSNNKQINFSNTGVLSITGATNEIGVDTSTGDVILTNLGVLSIDNDIYNPSNPVGKPELSFTNRAPGAGIAVNNSNGNTVLTNTGVLRIANGTPDALIIAYEETTGIATIFNTKPNEIQNTFRSITKFGSADTITATSAADSLNLNEGYGIKLNLNSSLKTIQIELDQKIDIIGSVFADNSTLLVDGVNGTIPYSVLSEAPTALSEFSNDLDYASIVGNTIQINGLPINTSLNGNLLDSSSLTIIVDPVAKEFFGKLIGSLTGDVLGDLKGSVFGDDSNMLVNSLDSKIVGPIDTTTVTTEKLIKKSTEISGATGIFDHDCTNSHIFIHSDIVGNFVPNLINFSLDIGEFAEVTFILIQGATGRTINGFRIDGIVPQLRWLDGVQPTGTANSRDIIRFEILRRDEGYSVYGNLKSFAALT